MRLLIALALADLLGFFATGEPDHARGRWRGPDLGIPAAAAIIDGP